MVRWARTGLGALALTSFLISPGVTVRAQGEYFAPSIVRDTEIEEILHNEMDPVFAAANIDPKRVELYVVQDPEVNAETGSDASSGSVRSAGGGCSATGVVASGADSTIDSSGLPRPRRRPRDLPGPSVAAGSSTHTSTAGSPSARTGCGSFAVATDPTSGDAASADATMVWARSGPSEAMGEAAGAGGRGVACEGARHW